MSETKKLALPNLTIDSVSNAKSLLLGALDSSSAVTIAADSIESIDLAGFQLLVSLFRHASAAGKKASIQGPLRESVREKIRLVGLCEGPCETGEQLTEACAAC